MSFNGRGWRLGAGAGLLLVGLVSAGVAWATLLTPQPVVTAKGRQFGASATPGGTYLSYDQSRPGHPSQFDVYVKPAGVPSVQGEHVGEWPTAVASTAPP